MEGLQQPGCGEASAPEEFAFLYVDAAPHDEVMMEQLEYLLLHCRSGRHAECADCARLDRVSGHLMAPFF
jgi:hypothetical protein